MLVIRLRRIGRKHDPHYRIVVAEHTSPVQGKFIAEVGHYHPKSKELVVRTAELTEWMNKGATPSNTVAKLAQRAAIDHKQVVVEAKAGQPKKKAQEAAKAKADKAAAAAEAAAQPAVEESMSEEAPADEASADESTDTVEETPTEEATEADVTEATETPAEEITTEDATDEAAE